MYTSSFMDAVLDAKATRYIMSHAVKWDGMKSADSGKLSQGKQGNTKPMRLSRPSLHPLLHP